MPIACFLTGAAPRTATERRVPPMERSLEQYIKDTFPTALERGYIQAYYQPVIRTISRKLCSFEALARWEDPERGLIRPDQFIPILEENKTIHLLDGCIIRQACARIRETMDRGDTPVPVSVNLSRLDFSLCDVFGVVQETVNHYQIPHDFLYIEITESIMAEKEQLMKAVMRRFRSAGYQVWMDDFGSAYSSLNVLKDFSFDELKMDMRFLSSFDQRSRRIMSSVIQMAKEIEIHTLAEGVETEEQFRFLRNIGCEKVQGFYFGWPQPYQDAMRHLREMGIDVEKPQDRMYYDSIGKINLLSAVPFMDKAERDSLTTARQLNSIPLAIAEGRKNSFSILFYNTAFENTARGTGMLISNIFTQDLLCKPQPYSLLPARAQNLLDSTRVNGDGRMLFISNKEYYEIQAKCIAQTKDAYSVLFRLSNLSKAAESARTDQLDEGMRQLYTLFERVTLLDAEADTITPLYMAAKEDLVSGRKGIRRLSQEYAQRWIFPEDRQDYLAFSDGSTLEERLTQSGRTHLSQSFRTYTRHGQYIWKQYTVLRLSAGVYVEMIRDVHKEVTDFVGKLQAAPRLDRDGLSPTLLWNNLVQSGILRLFWKDLDRRFLGASQGFLDYYGFNSIQDIRGKNDEDLGWHIRPDHYMQDEMRVIQEGITTHNEPGRCISNGENREILASKAPLYDENGQIMGLMGYFIDKELLTINDSRGNETTRRDQLTGLLNSRGISEEAHAFQDEYYLRNVDFVRVHVGIDDFPSLNRQYGFDFGDKAIAILGKALKKAFGLTSAVGRYSGHQFVILHQIRNKEELLNLREKINEIAAGIQKIDGMPLTFYLSMGYSLYSEDEDLTEQTQKAEVRLLADHAEHTSTDNRLSRSTEIFHLYDDLPISYSVYKVLVNEKNQVYDAVIFYVNRMFERESGKSASEILGRSTRDIFPALPEVWYQDAQKAALSGETTIGKMYYAPTGKTYYMTVSQVIHSGYCCFTFQKMDEADSAEIR